MADTPDDLPPIGTAQNAADVARKAELAAALSATYTHDMTAQETVDFANGRSQGLQLFRALHDLGAILENLGGSAIKELNLNYDSYTAVQAALAASHPKVTNALYDAQGRLTVAGISIACVT